MTSTQLVALVVSHEPSPLFQVNGCLLAATVKYRVLAETLRVPATSVGRIKVVNAVASAGPLPVQVISGSFDPPTNPTPSICKVKPAPSERLATFIGAVVWLGVALP